MNLRFKLVFISLCSGIVVLFNNCGVGFSLDVSDPLVLPSGQRVEQGVDDSTINQANTPLSGTDLLPIIIPDPSYRDQFIEKPDWSFEDDFEGAKDSNFWTGSGINAEYGRSCSSAPGHSGKVIQFNYKTFYENGVKHAHSEQRYKVPSAVELEYRFKLFVPKNYIPNSIGRNHKTLVNWSGTYGKVKSNISISSESWETSGGATPSVYVGEDGHNYGHHMLSTENKMFYENQGSWQEMVYYIRLAQVEGDHGVFRVYRNGKFLTGTDHPDVRRPGSYAPTTDQVIKYSSRGNFIDQGYLMGWSYGGFGDDLTVFCVDDFSLKIKTK